MVQSVHKLWIFFKGLECILGAHSMVHSVHKLRIYYKGLECILGAHSMVHNVHKLWIYSGFRTHLRSPFHGA
jgi:methionine synthase I (cobalamin-dependent)